MPRTSIAAAGQVPRGSEPRLCQLDRFGKDIRGAPRNALVADITPHRLLGAAFGLRQALNSAGAFVGPLVGVGLILLVAMNIIYK